MTGVRRFACTQCGACCNRSPEVELSEAAALADIFVFRMLFRVYTLARAFERSRSDTPEIFYQKKRLLSEHAARASSRKAIHDGKPTEVMDYLMISALALDTNLGTCTALSSGRCSIHERRPLTCRTVPLHYARAEGLAERDFDEFVGTPGYRCSTDEHAPVVIDQGLIVDAETKEARWRATAVAETDRKWKEAIVRRMKGSRDPSLPTLQDVHANAPYGAMTTSMRVGWEIASEVGLMSAQEFQALIETQRRTIERELAEGGAASEERQTLQEMAVEYR
jgi:Fe-S-cluster containining protein